MLVLLLIIFGLFLLVILASAAGYIFNNQNLVNTPSPYSVVIAARNEQNSILRCLHSLINQKWLPDEIIIINDHSEDNTASLSIEFGIHSNIRVSVIDAPTDCIGKKQCIAFAVKEARNNCILETDADSFPQSNWACSLLGALGSKKRLVSTPVLYSKSKILHGIMHAEYLGLISVSVGFAKLGKPTMVSAASMAFFRQDYLDYVASGIGSKHQSGDDVFFMQYIQGRFGSYTIALIDKNNSLVITSPPSSYIEWINQRVRWASKSLSYRGFFNWLLPLLVLTGNLCWSIAVVNLLLISGVNTNLLILIFIKPLIESLTTMIAAIKWNQFHVIYWLPLVSLLYPLFTLAVILSSLLIKQQWKGRALH